MDKIQQNRFFPGLICNPTTPTLNPVSPIIGRFFDPCSRVGAALRGTYDRSAFSRMSTVIIQSSELQRSPLWYEVENISNLRVDEGELRHSPRHRRILEVREDPEVVLNPEHAGLLPLQVQHPRRLRRDAEAGVLGGDPGDAVVDEDELHEPSLEPTVLYAWMKWQLVMK